MSASSSCKTGQHKQLNCWHAVGMAHRADMVRRVGERQKGTEQGCRVNECQVGLPRAGV